VLTTATRALAATAATMLLLLPLSACSDDAGDEPRPEGPSDFLGQTVAPDGEDGLPADYPRDVAPLLLGQSSSSEFDAESGYSVTTTFSSALTVDVLAQAVAKLTDAGWEVTTPASGGADAPVLSTILSLDDGVAIIQAVRSEDDVNLTYLVRPPAA
jgi:hypothetical protein